MKSYEYCPKCDKTVEIRSTGVVGYITWKCVECGTVCDQEFDDDNEDDYEYPGSYQ